MGQEFHLHVEGEAHLFVEVADEDVREVLDERLHGDVLVLLLLCHAFAGHSFGQRGDGLGGTATILVIVLGEHDVQSVVDDSRQLGVLDERHLVDMLRLVTSHQQILVEISEIRHQFLLHKFCIQVRIVVFQVDEIVVGRAFREHTNGLRQLIIYPHSGRGHLQVAMASILFVLRAGHTAMKSATDRYASRPLAIVEVLRCLRSLLHGGAARGDAWVGVVVNFLGVQFG